MLSKYHHNLSPQPEDPLQADLIVCRKSINRQDKDNTHLDSPLRIKPFLYVVCHALDIREQEGRDDDGHDGQGNDPETKEIRSRNANGRLRTWHLYGYDQ